MSKQQGQCPEPEVRSKGKSGKKRHGKYEVWMRTNPELKKEGRQWYGLDWHKIRSYKTLELAEKNRDDFTRKWNSYYSSIKNPIFEARWEFEVRIKS
jgi:hypothetical protein